MSDLNKIFAFTDLYITLDDWESSYCYYPKDKTNIKKNNPPKLISEEQKLNLEKSKLDFEDFLKIDSLNMGNHFHKYKKEDVIFPELILEYELRLINQRIKNIN